MKKLVVLVFISLILVSSVYAFSFQELFSKITGKAVSEDYQLDDFMIDKICKDYENLGKLSYGECSSELRKSNGLFLAEQFCSEIGGNFDQGCYFSDELGDLSLDFSFGPYTNNSIFSEIIVGRDKEMWIKDINSGNWRYYPESKESEFCDDSINNPFCENRIMNDQLDYVIIIDANDNGIDDLAVGQKNKIWVNWDKSGWRVYDSSEFATDISGIDPFNTSEIMENRLYYYLARDLDQPKDGKLDVLVGQKENVWFRSSLQDNKWSKFNVNSYCNLNQINDDPSCSDIFSQENVDFYYVGDDGVRVIMGKDSKIWSKNSNGIWSYYPNSVDSDLCNNEENNPFCNIDIMNNGIDYYFTRDKEQEVSLNLFLLNSTFTQNQYIKDFKVKSYDFNQLNFKTDKIPGGDYLITINSEGFLEQKIKKRIIANETNLNFISFRLIRDFESKSNPTIESIFPKLVSNELIIPGSNKIIYLNGSNFDKNTKVYLDNKEIKKDSLTILSSELIKITLYSKPEEGLQISLIKDYLPEYISYPAQNEDGISGYYQFNQEGELDFIENDYSLIIKNHEFSTSQKKVTPFWTRIFNLEEPGQLSSQKTSVSLTDKQECELRGLVSKKTDESKTLTCGNQEFNPIYVESLTKWEWVEDIDKCVEIGTIKTTREYKCTELGKIFLDKEESEMNGRGTWLCSGLYLAVGAAVLAPVCDIVSVIRTESGLDRVDITKKGVDFWAVKLDYNYKRDPTEKYCKSKEGSKSFYYKDYVSEDSAGIEYDDSQIMPAFHVQGYKDSKITRDKDGFCNNIDTKIRIYSDSESWQPTSTTGTVNIFASIIGEGIIEPVLENIGRKLLIIPEKLKVDHSEEITNECKTYEGTIYWQPSRIEGPGRLSPYLQRYLSSEEFSVSTELRDPVNILGLRLGEIDFNPEEISQRCGIKYTLERRENIPEEWFRFCIGGNDPIECLGGIKETYPQDHCIRYEIEVETDTCKNIINENTKEAFAIKWAMERTPQERMDIYKSLELVR